MTKRLRKQLVELLKCAADIVSETTRPTASAAEFLGYETLSNQLMEAMAARRSVSFVMAADNELYRYQLLEAAARVEEGSYP